LLDELTVVLAGLHSVARNSMTAGKTAIIFIRYETLKTTKRAVNEVHKQSRATIPAVQRSIR